MKKLLLNDRIVSFTSFDDLVDSLSRFSLTFFPKKNEDASMDEIQNGLVNDDHLRIEGGRGIGWRRRVDEEKEKGGANKEWIEIQMKKKEKKEEEKNEGQSGDEE